MRNIIKRSAGVVALAVVFVVALALPAFATPADPLDGAGADFLTGVTDWVSTYGILIVVGLLVLGGVIAVFIKMAKKGVRAL